MMLCITLFLRALATRSALWLLTHYPFTAPATMHDAPHHAIFMRTRYALGALASLHLAFYSSGYHALDNLLTEYEVEDDDRGHREEHGGHDLRIVRCELTFEHRHRQRDRL